MQVWHCQSICINGKKRKKEELRKAVSAVGKEVSVSYSEPNFAQTKETVHSFVCHICFFVTFGCLFACELWRCQSCQVQGSHKFSPPDSRQDPETGPSPEYLHLYNDIFIMVVIINQDENLY